MPKVGFLIDRWDPERGGAEGALADLADHLAGRGWEVHAFAHEGRARPGVRVQRVPARGLGREARVRHSARDLPAAARAAGMEVTVGLRHLRSVDLFWPHGGAHAASLRARRLSRGHDPDAPARGRHALFLELEEELLGGAARCTACVSDLVREELATLHPGCEARLSLHPNGVDLERFHPERNAAEGVRLRAALGLAPDRPLLVFPAADPRVKGFALLVDALARLCDRPWQLLLAGARRPAFWARRARVRLGPERVRAEARLPAPALYAAADLVLLPTWRDPCSLATLEALATGVPVLTTAANGASEVLSDPAQGAVLPREPEAWARAVAERLEGDPDPEAARRAVAGRSAEAWLAGLGRRLEELTG